MSERRDPARPRRLVAVSLKSYFGFAQTVGWLAELERALAATPPAEAVEIAVLPSYPLLERAVKALSPHGVAIGAQDVSWADNGSYTGEVTASTLAEIGCRYAEVGHAERRQLFGETDAVLADKAAAAVRHGLVPLVCVGEAERMDARTAAKEVVRQTVATLKELSEAEVVVAYEPVWAIGAEAPASADHVLEVGRILRDHLSGSGHAARVLYGGSAGPGTLPLLTDEFDGVFLGRRAHRVAGLLAVVEEAGPEDGGRPFDRQRGVIA
ncbi:MAG: triosephosphate isomerase [Solirubrobacterales bacterium]|nr:triosephosphate isomerase [Solirubrobacterales bacterium]